MSYDDFDSLDPFGSIDEGIRAGFGRRASVLGCLEARTGSVLRLALPETGDEREPVIKPAPPEAASDLGSRYQVLGEIARGGLGVVMKGRDLDLGRDVAVKVLHERYKEDRRVIERFVEEAQIGGQLQHPGIVPVYELGLRADERPFFAMKLVKGETLAAMLRKRRDPAEDQQRFLRVFLQICQTVAYAHARRVVHRDLKPSNVLVGAFGEVQVVDWGLAKVLRAGGAADDRPARRDAVSAIETIRTAEGGSASLVGSVLGTPAYMPPEQARGEVERMDARSDVFALGAVLCEVLTGRPPYDDGDPAAALAQAAECRQEAALRRLEAAGTDPELAALTRSCLAPSRDVRPLDAGEVARRIEDHLQSTEERARRAEVRAAELRVRARAQVVLAAVVLVALVIAGTAYTTWDGLRRARRAETASRADAAVAETTRLVGQAQQAGLGGVELWRRALVAAQRAAEVVETGDADAALEARVAALVREVAEGEEQTRDAALEEEAHALLLERLREVRIGPDVVRIDLFLGPERRERESARRAVEYGALFATVGVDERSPADAVAGRFDCAHRTDVALALDAWAEARRVAALFADGPDPESWRPLVRLARRLDPGDAWRNALRDELGREELDARALRALAAQSVLRERRAEEVALVVALLDAAGDLEGAIEAQIEGMLTHPSDYWLNASFPSLCSQEELTGRLYEEEASWAVRAAQALRPGSRAVRFQVAMERFQDTGEELLRELAREDPDDPFPQAMLFMLLMQRGRFEEAFGMLPDVFPALQRTGVDWDYAPLLWSFGYDEELLAGPDVPPLAVAMLHLTVGRYEEAWAILSEHRDELRPAYPWLFLPLALGEADSAESLRATVEHLRGLASADEATLRATPAVSLLAATDICDGVSGALLFRRAFENEPAVKELGSLARARQVAAFTAAAASVLELEAPVVPAMREQLERAPELTPELRAELRQLALGWMNEELDVIERDLTDPGLTRERATTYSRNFHQMTIYGWLAPIRDEAFLAEMDPGQAHACRLLWARVAGLEAMLVHLTSGPS